MKQFFVIVFFTILFFTLICLYISENIYSYGLDEISTHNDVIEYSNNLYVRLDDTNSDVMNDLKDKYFKQLMSIDETKVFIFEIKVGDKYIQKGGTHIQDATIIKVIKGNENMNNKKIYITRTGGIIVNQTATEKVYIDTLTCINIMKPGDRYLVFCEESELSQLVDSKIPQFRCVIAKFGILNIDKDDKCAVADYTTFSDTKFVKYNMIINQEFLTTSNNTLAEFNKIKHEIFAKYNIE